MQLIINLKRNKKNKKPFYKIVVINSQKKNKVIDKIGYYNPLSNPKQIAINKTKLYFWSSNGAKLNKVLYKIINNFA